MLSGSRELVWPCGRAGKQYDLGSTRFHCASALFSLEKVVVSGFCLAALPFIINETLKWLSSLSVLMQESFMWRQNIPLYAGVTLVVIEQPSVCRGHLGGDRTALCMQGSFWW